MGIANIWRFSAVVGQSGGGTFLFIFMLSVIFLALPLMMLEMAVGRHLESDVVSAFNDLKKRFLPFGLAIAVVLVVLTGVYLVITGWTLAFLIISITPLDTDFSGFTGTYYPLLFFLASLAITTLIVAKGVVAGIERIVTKLVPLSFVILGVLFVYSMTTDGFVDSLRYLFTPDLSMIGDTGVWVAAVGQAFFSLAVGYGLILTYSSYMPHDADIPRSAAIITIADVGVAVLAGTIIFSVVFAQGLDPASGADLAFTTLPIAFDNIPTVGWLLAILFFALLFTTAITSSVSMMEVPVAAIINNTKIARRKATYIISSFLLVLGGLAALSYSRMDLRIGGERVLDSMDHIFGTMGIPIAALITATVFAWYIEDRQIIVEMHPFWGHVVVPLVKYLVPPVLLIVILAQFIPF